MTGGNRGLPAGRVRGLGVRATLRDPQLGRRTRRLWARLVRPQGVPVTRWPKWARLTYEWCVRNAGRWPYVYGGGHVRVGFPSSGGYDCSGIVDGALHAGGILENRGTIGTHELERYWGARGFGQRVTVWVADRVIGGRMVEHCVLEFPEAAAAHRFFMAYYTGGPRAGFARSFNTSGYTPSTSDKSAVSWLTWEWVEQTAGFAVVSTLVGGAILVPLGHLLLKRLKNWFDPKSKGGLGDLAAPDGRPMHQYLAEPPGPAQ